MLYFVFPLTVFWVLFVTLYILTDDKIFPIIALIIMLALLLVFSVIYSIEKVVEAKNKNRYFQQRRYGKDG